MKTPGQRGLFGEWLVANRQARFPRQRDALAAYERLAGLKIAASEYAQWESGSRVPRDDNPKAQALFDFYGSRPEPLGNDGGGSVDLTAALAAQTAAITALVERIDRLVTLSTEEMPATLAASLGAAMREVLPILATGSGARSPRAGGAVPTRQGPA